MAQLRDGDGPGPINCPHLRWGVDVTLLNITQGTRPRCLDLQDNRVLKSLHLLQLICKAFSKIRGLRSPLGGHSP